MIWTKYVLLGVVILIAIYATIRFEQEDRKEKTGMFRHALVDNQVLLTICGAIITLLIFL